MAENQKPVATPKPKMAGVKPTTAAKPVAAPKPAAPVKPEKTIKPVKVKMVRNSYSMPAADHALLSEIKDNCLQTGLKVKKGDLLRAGLHLLTKLSPTDLAKLLKKSCPPRRGETCDEIRE